MKKKLAIILFITALSFPAILPYFHTGYFPTHDGEWAVVRLTDMYREMKDLQFPPRFSGNLNFGYGYPLFNFAYPFPYYLGFILHLFRFGFVDSIKILFAASVPLAAFFMYVLSREVWGKPLAGVISSILYIYLPYRFVDLYVRGSIGESLAIVLFPLILFSLLKLFENTRSRIYFISLAVSLSALIMTHNIMTVLFLPIIIVTALALHIRSVKKPSIHVYLALVLGVMMTAFFWLPALAEKNYIALSKIPIADRSLYFVTLPQLFIPSWGYGTPTESNGFSYQLGWPQIVSFLIVASMVVLSSRARNERSDLTINSEIASSDALLAMTTFQTRLASVFVIVTLFLICLLFQPSHLIWENVPLLKEINYPWTLLAPLGFLMSLLAGFLAKKKQSMLVGLLLATCAVISFISYARPQYFIDRGDQYYLTNEATTTSSDELMPLWVKSKPTERAKEKVVFVKGTGTISNILFNSKKVSFTDSSPQENAVVRVNTIYYPGWKAYVDGKEVPIDYQSEHGVMDIQISQNLVNVELIFSETPLRLFADGVSAISLVMLLIFSVWKMNHEKGAGVRIP